MLAAGASSRMGRPKADLTLGPAGLTFVDAIVKTLTASGVSIVRLVVAAGGSRRGADVVVNPDPEAGMLSSIHCGLRALPHGLQGVLVWPVDHPLVGRATVIAMIDALRSGGAPIVVPTHDGRRGHPVLFSARVLPELLEADASRGAVAVVKAHDDRLELTVPDRGILCDVDTPEDYERFVSTFGETPPELR